MLNWYQKSSIFVRWCFKTNNNTIYDSSPPRARIRKSVRIIDDANLRTTKKSPVFCFLMFLVQYSTWSIIAKSEVMVDCIVPNHVKPWNGPNSFRPASILPADVRLDCPWLHFLFSSLSSTWRWSVLILVLMHNILWSIRPPSQFSSQADTNKDVRR